VVDHRDVEILDHIPRGLDGNQDLVVMRRRARGH
jgi:hypothetical protein